MGFLTPKVSMPATPAVPEAEPEVRIEQVENDVEQDLSAKRRKRKGLESTLLSRNTGEEDTSPNSKTANDSLGSSASGSGITLGSGLSGDRKTLG